MHGYQIIKMLEERSQGVYSPSAGTIYPALQDLHEKGFIAISEQQDKKIYSLQEQGEQHLQEWGGADDEFWSEWRRRLAWKHSEEFKAVREEMEQWERQLHATKKYVANHAQDATEFIKILAAAREQLARLMENEKGLK